MSIAVEAGDLQSLRLGAALPNGRGGQGTVHAVLGRDDVVAKVYHPEQRPNDATQQRLLRLIHAGNESLRGSCAWPLALLTIDGQTTLVLPRVPQGMQLHELMDRPSRLLHFGGVDWAFIVLVAQRLADAVAAVHGAGLLLVDFTETNALVDAAGRVTLIDCDSFRFQGQGVDSCSSTYTLGWTAPELIGQPLGRMPRTLNHDNFALAVALFKLLFQGSEPMQQWRREDGQAGPRVFVFSRRRPVRMANVNELTLDALPPSLAELFERAFDPASDAPLGGRPTARQWADELRALGKHISYCDNVPGHSYYAELRACPWCAMARVHPDADHFRSEVTSSPSAHPVGKPSPGAQTGKRPRRRWPWLVASALVVGWAYEHMSNQLPLHVDGRAEALKQRAAADVAQILALINSPNLSAERYAARFAPNALVHKGQRYSQPRYWADHMVNQWPQRHYLPRSGEPRIDCDVHAQQCEVDMVVDFEVENPDLGKHNAGCWNYLLTLDMSSTPSRILREDKGPRCGAG